MNLTSVPNIDDVRGAAQRIKDLIHRTPILTSAFFNDLIGAEIFFKCENFQRIGAFKYRGATNAVLSLTDEEARRGVVTHSSGNHAQAVALAARKRNIPAHIVMPRTAPAVKKRATEGYGAVIHLCEPTLESREKTAEYVQAKFGATFIHPYNNKNVIAGQGTAALELLEDTDGLDLVIAPVGGGGLLSGTAIAVTETSPKTKVWGAEPFGADDAYRSLKEGRIIPSIKPKTRCDALLTSLGELTFTILSSKVSSIVTVEDEITITAMKHVFERMKIVIEVSSAVPIGALMKVSGQLQEYRKIGVILSGGNSDLSQLPW